jgi:hypothetical protein
MSNFSAFKVMRNHIHQDLKMEYMYEEDPRVLWSSLKIVMNNIKLSSSPRQCMSGTIYVYKISKLWMSSTMSFIRYALSSDFVRENLLKRKKLRRLYLLCSLQKGLSLNNIMRRI